MGHVGHVVGHVGQFANGSDGMGYAFQNVI